VAYPIAKRLDGEAKKGDSQGGKWRGEGAWRGFCRDLKVPYPAKKMGEFSGGVARRQQQLKNMKSMASGDYFPVAGGL